MPQFRAGYQLCADCKRQFVPSQPWQRFCLRAKCQRTRHRIAKRAVRARNRDRINALARARYAADPEPKRAAERARYRMARRA